MLSLMVSLMLRQEESETSKPKILCKQFEATYNFTSNIDFEFKVNLNFKIKLKFKFN